MTRVVTPRMASVARTSVLWVYVVVALGSTVLCAVGGPVGRVHAAPAHPELAARVAASDDVAMKNHEVRCRDLVGRACVRGTRRRRAGKVVAAPRESGCWPGPAEPAAPFNDLGFTTRVAQLCVWFATVWGCSLFATMRLVPSCTHVPYVFHLFDTGCHALALAVHALCCRCRHGRRPRRRQKTSPAGVCSCQR